MVSDEQTIEGIQIFQKIKQMGRLEDEGNQLYLFVVDHLLALGDADK